MADIERLLLGGRVRRAATPAALLAKGMAAAALARGRALRGDSVVDIAADPRLISVAEDMARSLGEMKGAAMKIGQALSFVDVNLIPEEYRQALGILQSDAPPMPYSMVCQVVEDELGGPPDKVFTWFSPQPMAAASIGQVHMAHLGDHEVVVKVQYPGVTSAVEADLRNAALISLMARVGQKLLGGLIGEIDIRSLIDEVRDRVSEELDYRIEAANQREFVSLFAGDPSIHIPGVVSELSTRRVLVTDYVDAMRWNAALAQPQELRDQWGKVISRFVNTSLYRHGVINVDTHPGNYLFHDNGTVTFLDFGCVTRFTSDQIARMRGVLYAILDGDETRLLDSLQAMGMLRSSRGVDIELVRRPLELSIEGYTGAQPFRYTREMVADAIAENMKLRLGADELRLLQRLDCPREYVLLGRILVGLVAVLAHLEAAVDHHELFDEVFGDDPDRPNPWAPPDSSAAA